ncbi:MAG: hypothetical protein AMS26_12015 [Bacteroides sp. SM23_62]|nr:MAG: hypothetical protein AMS26_12015 [Bacteroides sp. SM23_62]
MTPTGAGLNGVLPSCDLAVGMARVIANKSIPMYLMFVFNNPSLSAGDDEGYLLYGCSTK